MNAAIRKEFDNLYSADKGTQHQAFISLMKRTDKPVDWTYDVWDELIENLSHKNNRQRAIAAQLLCNLAKSDPKKRILKDFPALLAVTKDERFVTARHTLQSLWKIGVVGKRRQKTLLEGLDARFRECEGEKNGTLIRYDILVGLRKLYDEVNDETIRKRALKLVELEDDPKYRKKYATVWKSA